MAPRCSCFAQDIVDAAMERDWEHTQDQLLKWLGQGMSQQSFRSRMQDPRTPQGTGVVGGQFTSQFSVSPFHQGASTPTLKRKLQGGWPSAPAQEIPLEGQEQRLDARMSRCHYPHVLLLLFTDI